MNTITAPSVETEAQRPASAAFSLHRCNRLSNVLAALKLRRTDAELAGVPAPRSTPMPAAATQPGRLTAPHYMSLR